MKRRQFGGILLLLAAAWWAYTGGATPGNLPGTGIKSCLITYDASRNGELPYEQVTALSSERVADYLDEHCDKDDQGIPRWRKLDKDADMSYAAQEWKDAMALPREKEPWVILSNGKSGYSGPYPENTDKTLELLEKYLP